jgi:hypothetical protein
MIQGSGWKTTLLPESNRCLAEQTSKELGSVATTYQHALSFSASRLLKMVKYSSKNRINKIMDTDQTISAAA